MSDARLRELERRWKETGSPDDEAAYLLERVRVGDLTRERLELAAYCGREGASLALGWDLQEAEGIARLLDRLKTDKVAAAVFNRELALSGLERWEAEFAPHLPEQLRGLPRKALVLASPGAAWPSSDLIQAAERAIYGRGAFGPATGQTLGAGMTVLTFLLLGPDQAHDQSVVEMACMDKAARISRPFVTSEHALQIGSGAVARFIVEGVVTL